MYFKKKELKNWNKKEFLLLLTMKNPFLNIIISSIFFIYNSFWFILHYHKRKTLEKTQEKVKEWVNNPIHIIPFMQVGRLVHVKENENDFGWGVVVNFQKKILQVWKYLTFLKEKISFIQCCFYRMLRKQKFLLLKLFLRLILSQLYSF